MSTWGPNARIVPVTLGEVGELLDRSRWSRHAYSVWCRHNETAGPSSSVGGTEPTDQIVTDSPLLGIRQPNEQDPVMCPGREPTNVREIQILSDEQAPFGLRCCPHIGIGMPAQAFVKYRVYIEPRRGQSTGSGARDVLVKLEPHATLISGGIGVGAGKSSLAAAAAKAMTARMSGSVRLGNSARISVDSAPCAK